MKFFGTMKINDKDHLEIGGIDVLDLAESYGTPLYIMDQALVEENMSNLKSAFISKKVKTDVIYASKAFLTVAVCQLVNKMGLSLDVVSGGELYTAKIAGFPGEKIYMHGNNKTYSELELAIDYGVGYIIIDNMYEFDKIEDICKRRGKKVKALLRVNPGIDAHTHEYIQTSTLSSKFGESIFDEKIKDMIKTLSSSEYVIFEGFHCHIGSQIFEEKSFFAEIEVMLDFVKKINDNIGFETKTLNLGGGFGIYYAEGDTPFELKDCVSHMTEILDKKIDEHKLKIEKAMIEPGRSIVANAGTTLYSIGGYKETISGKKYIFVDGGMTDNPRPALYQAVYEGAIANKMSGKDFETVTVAGKCCESGDILIKDATLQKSDVGDYLAIFSTGAYNYSMSSNYNRIAKPAVVMVKDGKSKLIVKRETYEDLIRNDLPLE